MKTFQIPMLSLSLLGLCLLSGLNTPIARADFVRGTPVNVRSVVPVIDPALDTPECISSDELEMYITSGRPDMRDFNIYVLKRASKEDAWGPPEKLGPMVNSSSGNEDAGQTHLNSEYFE